MIRRYPSIPVKINYILEGSYIDNDGFGSMLVTKFGMPITRVHIIATVTNIYITDDKKYAFIVLDDGSGNIRSKVFQDVSVFEKIKVGQLVDFIGRIREYNDERYLVPEIVRVVEDPNMITLRVLEIANTLKIWIDKFKDLKTDIEKSSDISVITEKFRMSDDEVKAIINFINGNIKSKEEEEIEEVDTATLKEELLKKIEEMDDGDGVDYSDILKAMDFPEQTIEKILDELLAEGSCYEPRAGKIKAL